MSVNQRDRPVRVVYLGTPEFAVSPLMALHADPRIDVRLVVTQPNRPAGRGRRLTPPPVAEVAIASGIPVYQPESLRAVADAAPLLEAAPDVLVVVAYGELLRRHVLHLAPHQCINVHPSLLPRYRGAAPIQAAIRDGSAQTGVSIMRLVRKLDAGPIIAQRVFDVAPDATSATLSDALSMLASEMLPDVVWQWVTGDLAECEQDEELVTHTREWTVDDAHIDWSASSTSIERLVRAANPWPIAWTQLAGERVQIHAARVAAADADVPTMEAGVVTLQRRQVLVGTGDGVLELTRVQPAGKRQMAAGDWWRGLRRDTARFDT